MLRDHGRKKYQTQNDKSVDKRMTNRKTYIPTYYHISYVGTSNNLIFTRHLVQAGEL